MVKAMARVAFGNARVHARKSQLLTPAVLAALATAETPQLTVPGWRDIDSDEDAASLIALLYGKLMADYQMLIAAYSAAAPILQAMARWHEVENVKTAWRATANRIDPARWQLVWRPMGALESVALRACLGHASLQQLCAVLAHTPYAAIAARILRSHASDLAAAELTLDRWASDVVGRAAAALPPEETAAATLARTLVCERETAILERAMDTLGLSGAPAMQMAPTLNGALGRSAADRLAAWTRDGGAPIVLPRTLSFDRRAVRTFVEFRRALGATRRVVCRQAFLADPFCIAPALALVLMREDETRALISVGELRAAHATPNAVMRLLSVDG